MSKQKKLITEILAASYAHPTASQIFEEARKKMPNIALGTVYRNLGILVDEGTIVRLSVTGQPDRFDLPDDAGSLNYLRGREFVIPPADIWFTKGFDLKGKGVPKWDVRPTSSPEGGRKA